MSDESAVVYVCVMDDVHWHLYPHQQLTVVEQPTTNQVHRPKVKREKIQVPKCIRLIDKTRQEAMGEMGEPGGRVVEFVTSPPVRGILRPPGAQSTRPGS